VEARFTLNNGMRMRTERCVLVAMDALLRLIRCVTAIRGGGGGVLSRKRDIAAATSGQGELK
jgi:hypothetical protein